MQLMNGSRLELSIIRMLGAKNDFSEQCLECLNTEIISRFKKDPNSPSWYSADPWGREWAHPLSHTNMFLKKSGKVFIF